MNDPRHPQPIDEVLLRKLWPTGLPDKLIEERMGHSRGSLYRRARKLGLGSRRLARVRVFEREGAK